MFILLIEWIRIQTLLIQLSLTECGWNFLNDLCVLEKLASLQLWQNPPKALFLDPKEVSKSTYAISNLKIDYQNFFQIISLLFLFLFCRKVNDDIDARKSDISQTYMECINNLVHFCLSSCSNPYWKRISHQVGYFLTFFISEWILRLMNSKLEKKNCLEWFERPLQPIASVLVHLFFSIFAYLTRIFME